MSARLLAIHIDYATRSAAPRRVRRNGAALPWLALAALVVALVTL